MSLFLEGQPDPAAITSALEGEAVHAALLLELQFVSGTLYLSNENVPFTDSKWGNTWQGMGELVGMGEVSGGTNNLAPYRQYFLGIPWELLNADERGIAGMGRIPGLIGNRSDFVGREANLYGQLFDHDTLTAEGRPSPIGHPFAIDTGLMDRVEASYEPGGALLTMTVEGPLARKGAPIYGLLTDRDQRKRHPGDTGLEYVPEVMSTNPTWTTW